MKRAAICIVSKEYMNMYGVHLESVMKWLPEFEPILYRLEEYIDLKEEYNYTSDGQFVCAVRPRIVLETFEKGYDQVLFLGSDVIFFNKPYELLNVSKTSVVPHITQPLPVDGKFPQTEDIHLTGHINSDCVLWTQNALEFLRWQDSIQKISCEDKKHSGKFLDQTWLNCLPFFVHNVRIIRNPGYNVAFFNLPTRLLFKSIINDRYRVEENNQFYDLTFFQFSAFDLKNPARVSKHNGRADVTGVELELMLWYKEQLEKNL